MKEGRWYKVWDRGGSEVLGLVNKIIGCVIKFEFEIKNKLFLVYFL